MGNSPRFTSDMKMSSQIMDSITHPVKTTV